ncbi:MAG: 50S ribosomal protein L10 [Caldilineaceae bacterium]|nr:50S ribosomal protein L10 [Caldilineaceae bacterium]MCB9140309.1 50S ribosomal protein L10 [Caldilineaceae bacterium]
MAISRARKEELVAEYKTLIENAPALVFTDYRGISVSKIQSLRAKLNETEATYAVVKNTLLRRALEESGQVASDELLEGPNAIVFSGEDIGRSVTALKDWIKAEKVVEIRGALMEGSVLNAAAAENLADLPTKEQTLAMILGAISGPARGIAGVINAPGSSLVRVLNAHVEKQQEAA